MTQYSELIERLREMGVLKPEAKIATLAAPPR